MEHRRRRPQGGEPVEAQERELPQQSFVPNEVNHGMSSTDDTHLRRRRRPQEQPTEAPTAQREQEIIPKKEPRAHIPQLQRGEAKPQPAREPAMKKEARAQIPQPQREEAKPQPAREPAMKKEARAQIPQPQREEAKPQPAREPAMKKEARAHIPQLPPKEDHTKRHAREGRRKTYTSRIPHRDIRALTDKAGKKALRGGKALLANLGGTLLLAVMALGEGIKAGRQWIKKEAARRRRPRVSESGHAPEREEIVLEAIRPQDYHGKAHSRTAAQSHTPHEKRFVPGRIRRKSRKLDAQQILSLIFAGVAVFSACMIVSILWRTVRTTQTNKRLVELREQASAATPEPTDAPQMAVFLPEEEEEAEPVPTPAYASLPDSTTVKPDEEKDKDPAQEETAGPVPDVTVAPMGVRTYHHVGGDALPEMEALHKENRDIVGWLRIDNVLDLPVVYRDNSYYLTRDFYKQKNTAGTIFLDVNHPFKAKTQNLLLHGHNMKDGTMFGRLVQYETDLNYVRWHPFVRFDTLWRKEEYVIFAVLRVSLDVRSDEFFNYFSHPTFESDAAFESYIRQLRLRSIYAIPVDVEPTDALLTLSTCLEEDRLVIVARRVRSDETHMQLREVTNLTTRQ